MAADVKSVVADRVARTVPVFAGDREGLDLVLARRLSLWEAGAIMLKAHWINGIGPRGYRYVYAEFSSEHDYFRGGEVKLPTYLHQIFLEIAVETGAIGIVGYVLFLVLFFRKLLKLPRDQLSVIFPAALAVSVAVFALNVHKSFYGSFSSTMAWWLIVVLIGMLHFVRSEAMVTETERSGGALAK